ncbi:hypothetical protein B0H13DRAFT_1871586 [Mycena leptocephala]|nr:hypothetical protein B0H13DRAFT_1871586 [Mycena leptocephala]
MKPLSDVNMHWSCSTVVFSFGVDVTFACSNAVRMHPWTYCEDSAAVLVEDYSRGNSQARCGAMSLAPRRQHRPRQWVLCPSARPGGLVSYLRLWCTTAQSPLPPAVWQCALSTVMRSSIWLSPEPELEGKSGVDVNAVRSGQVEPVNFMLRARFSSLQLSGLMLRPRLRLEPRIQIRIRDGRTESGGAGKSVSLQPSPSSPSHPDLVVERTRSPVLVTRSGERRKAGSAATARAR